MDVGARRRAPQDVEVAQDHRPSRDDAEGAARLGEDLEAGAREAIPTLGGLIGIGGGADGHDLALPGLARQLPPQHVGHVQLHADGAAVRLAGRAVGAPLEAAHVAEGAAVGAAHVGIERPLEGHALHAVQRAATGLLAKLDGHIHQSTAAWDPRRP